MKWEYVRVGWSEEGGIWLGPWGKYGLEWIEEWLGRNFPQIRRVRVRQKAGRHDINVDAKGYHIDRLAGYDSHVAISLISALGAGGWEAIHIEGYMNGAGWFKRPIPESTTDTEESES